MDRPCRLCLVKADASLNIFHGKGKILGIANVLKKHFWFEVQPEDEISAVICLACWSKVDDFHQFYLHVEEVHNLLAKTKLKPSFTEIALQNPFLEEFQSEAHPTAMYLELDMDIKEEFIDQSVLQTSVEEQDQDKTESNPLEVVGSNLFNSTLEKHSLLKYEEADVKMCEEGMVEEALENRHPLQSQHSEDITEAVDDTDHGKATTGPMLEMVIAEAERPRERRQTAKSGKKSTTQWSKADKSLHNVKKQKRRRIISEHDDELIKKYISMGCELCPFVGNDFTEVTAHFRAEHKGQKPYVMCCGRKLNKRFLFVQHAYKHEDPEYYKCKECNKTFSDGYVLRSHILANHSTEEDLTFNCDKCLKKFSRRYLLELHKPSHIPPEERTFWCSRCPQPKAFASDHLLQIHINMRHTKAPNICHVCGKEIRDNQAFEKHVRLHFEDSGPRVKCPHPNCDRWLKDEDNLKQHLRRHNEDGKIFACTECGRACKNQRALRSHINYVHSNEVFACEECNKTFKKAITLREHMAQHTGETLYKCPFCTRNFNSNANMHAHKKKMHPLEWDIWRKTKRGSSQKLVDSSRNALPVVHDSESASAANSVNK